MWVHNVIIYVYKFVYLIHGASLSGSADWSIEARSVYMIKLPLSRLTLRASYIRMPSKLSAFSFSAAVYEKENLYINFLTAI